MKFSWKISALLGAILMVAGTARADHPAADQLSGLWKSEHGEYRIHGVEKHGTMYSFHFSRKAEIQRGAGRIECLGAGVYDRATGVAHAKDVCPTKFAGWNYLGSSTWQLTMDHDHPHLKGVRSEQYVGSGPRFHEHPHEHDETLSFVKRETPPGPGPGPGPTPPPIR